MSPPDHDTALPREGGAESTLEGMGYALPSGARARGLAALQHQCLGCLESHLRLGLRWTRWTLSDPSAGVMGLWISMHVVAVFRAGVGGRAAQDRGQHMCLG